MIAEVFQEYLHHKRDDPSLRSSSPMEGARNARSSLHAIREEESAQEQTNLAGVSLRGKNQTNASGVSGRRNPDEEGAAG